MGELILLAVLLIVILFPIGYIFKKRGKTKLLFIASCYGLVLIMQALLFFVVSPLIVLDLFFIPQLKEFGNWENVNFLNGLIGAIERYGFFVTLLLHIPVSIAVYKRYEIFR